MSAGRCGTRGPWRRVLQPAIKPPQLLADDLISPLLFALGNYCCLWITMSFKSNSRFWKYIDTLLEIVMFFAMDK